MNDLKIVFGSAVKTKRSALGISQEELADRAGLHRTYVSDIERGARNPSLQSIEKLASALDLSISTLFERTPDDKSPHLVEILLVEDDPLDLEWTLRAFQKANIANPVKIARDGQQALDFLFGRGPLGDGRSAALPGIVLLDLYLPRMNGLEVLRKIKLNATTVNIPVIVLTNSAGDLDFSECRRLGVTSYIVKPIDFQNFSHVTSALAMEWGLIKPDIRTAH